ncbi:MAG: hypothetical protein ACTSRP_07345 [Candidatus Helarchaeota archaeon]
MCVGWCWSGCLVGCISVNTIVLFYLLSSLKSIIIPIPIILSPQKTPHICFFLGRGGIDFFKRE